MNSSREKRLEKLNAKYLDKVVKVKSKANHPHKGETGKVIQFKEIEGLTGRLGMLIKNEKGNFYVFNWETQIELVKEIEWDLKKTS